MILVRDSYVFFLNYLVTFSLDTCNNARKHNFSVHTLSLTLNKNENYNTLKQSFQNMKHIIINPKRNKRMRVLGHNAYPKLTPYSSNLVKPKCKIVLCEEEMWKVPAELEWNDWKWNISVKCKKMGGNKVQGEK